MKTRDTTPRGRHRKKTLAVRMLVARLAWLDWPVRWQQGRVVWSSGQRSFTPRAEDFTAAARCLHKIPTYPLASKSVLGDVDAWLADRRRALEFARRVAAVRILDVNLLAESLQRRDLTAIAVAAECVIAEALCVAESAAPAVAAPLSRCGARGREALLPLVTDDLLPQPVRMLAAVTVGAIDGRAGDDLCVPSFATANNAIGRGYRFGKTAGVPGERDLTLPLLALDDGEFLAYRLEAALSATGTFKASTETLRTIARRVSDPREVVEVAEALLEAQPIADRILDIGPDVLADWSLCCHRVRPDMITRWFSNHGPRYWLSITEQGQMSAARSVDAVRSAFKSLIDSGCTSQDIRHCREIGTCIVNSGLGARLTLASPNAVDVLRHLVHHYVTLPRPLRASYLEIVHCRRHWLCAKTSAAPNDPRPWLTRVAKLLALSKSRDVVLEALALHVERGLCKLRYNRQRDFDAVLSCVRGQDPHTAQGIVDIIYRLGLADVPALLVRTILQSIQVWPEGEQNDIADALSHAVELSGCTLTVEQCLTLALPHLPDVHAWESSLGDAPESRRPPRYAAFASVYFLAVTGQRDVRGQLVRVMDILREHLLHGLSDDLLEAKLRLAFRVALFRPHRFADILTAALSRKFRPSWNSGESALKFIRDKPPLAELIVDAFPQHPQRCLKLMEDLERLIRISASADNIFDALRVEPDLSATIDAGACDADRNSVVSHNSQGGFITIAEYLSAKTGVSQEASVGAVRTTPTPIEQAAPPSNRQIRIKTGLSLIANDAGWYRMMRAYPSLGGVALAYIEARAIVGGNTAMPAGVERMLDRRRRVDRETVYLTAAVDAAPERQDLRKRLGSLRAQLADGSLAPNEQDLRELISNAVSAAVFDAVEHLVAQGCRRRLQAIVGPVAATVPLTDDLRNAVVLTGSHRTNRKLLLRLIRTHIGGGDADWREQHPKNIEIVAQLAGRGVRVDTWLSSFERRYPCAGIAGGWVTVRCESDPLRILQMGNHFGTCLSVGQMNDFSTIANACELNKRVIFAYDDDGRVVGRKLIGIAGNGGLLGFHTYSNNSEGRRSNELSRLIDQYAISFADACGLSLANEGTVERLFAEDWYDDGCVGWNVPAVEHIKEHPKGRRDTSRSSRSAGAAKATG